MLVPSNVLLVSSFRPLAFGLIAISLTATSCTTEQAEGKRCDIRNISLDCEAPLVCRPAAELSLQDKSEGVALCCPPQGSQVSVEACNSASSELPPDETVSDAGGSQRNSAPDASADDAGAGLGTMEDAAIEDAGDGTTTATDAAPESPAVSDAAADAGGDSSTDT